MQPRSLDWVQIEYVTNRDTRYELHTHTLRQSGVEVPVRAFEPQLIRRVTLSDVVVFGTTGIIRHKCTYVMTDAALQMLPDFKRSKSPFQVKPKPLPEAAMVHNYNAPFDFQHLLLHDAGKIITLFDTETISEQSKLLVPVMHPNTDTKFHAMFELLRTLGIPAEHVKSYEPHRNEYIIKKLHLVLSNFADYRYASTRSLVRSFAHSLIRSFVQCARVAICVVCATNATQGSSLALDRHDVAIARQVRARHLRLSASVHPALGRE